MVFGPTERRNLLPERLFGGVLQGSSETVRQAPREKEGMIQSDPHGDMGSQAEMT